MAKKYIHKLLLLFIISAALGYGGVRLGLTSKQGLVLAVFMMSIVGTLFFWDFKLSFAFIGSAVLVLIRAVDLPEFIAYASLDVILFLIAMMIIVGMMKDAGFFTWVITVVLRLRKLSGVRLFLILMAASAVLSGLMGEVASTVIMVTIILDICLFLETNPVPLVISSVLATNIGSAGTVLGNPIGVLIAARSGLTFEDFLVHAMPLASVALVISLIVLCVWHRSYIKGLTAKLSEYQDDKSFLYLIDIPADRKTRTSIGIFLVTILSISLHHRFEMLLGMGENTLLIMLPILSAGVVMLYRADKARDYVEKEVEWNSLLFFMFLFAQAGVVHASGVAAFLAGKIIGAVGNNMAHLVSLVLFSTGILSSVLDNTVVVASYVPITLSMREMGLSVDTVWWAMLFGACLGGNITVIGSTANIIALGLLEKKENLKVEFLEWFKIGLLVGGLTLAVALLALLYLPLFHAN